MGWWQIDPQTGMPAQAAQSALSRPPEFVLLNAVPGVDDLETACYLGDGPWDMASTLPNEIQEVIGDPITWSPDEIRRLLLNGQIPSGLEDEQSAELNRVVEAFWQDIDTCYEDDWERGSLPAERRWICEAIIPRLLEVGPE